MNGFIGKFSISAREKDIGQYPLPQFGNGVNTFVYDNVSIAYESANASYWRGTEADVFFFGSLLNRKELCEKVEKGVLDDDATPATVIGALGARMPLPSMMNMLNGPFCGFWFDRVHHEMTMFRDQLGQCSLFYANDSRGNTFFSNRLDVLAAISGFDLSMDLHGLGDYFSVGYIAAPRTIYAGISKVKAAHFVKVKRGTIMSNRRFWSVNYAPKHNASFKEATVQTRSLLKTAISRCMERSMNAAFLLSGGIDSGVVLGMVREQNQLCNRAVTIAFSNREYDESSLAAEMAAVHEVAHVIQLAEPSDMKILPRLMMLSGEPFADSSLLPTTIASSVASRMSSCVYIGDGGDEIFGGYRRYQAMMLRHCLWGIPGMIGSAVARLMIRFLIPPYENRSPYGNFYRSVRSLSLPPLEAYANFQEICSGKFRNELLACHTDANYLDDWRELLGEVSGNNSVESFNALDLMYYMPEDGCRKMELACQFADVEDLAPLMDMDVVNYLLRLPLDYRFNLKRNKLILRKLGENLLPDRIMNMPKRGFGLPVADWFRHELADAIKEMAASLEDWDKDGWLNHAVVRRVVQEHQEKGINHGALLWMLHCLYLWKIGPV